MTGALPAESQLLVYCWGFTFTFRLSVAWQEHFLLSHNFRFTVVAIPIHSGCQVLQEHYLLSHNIWYTIGFSGYTYTFRLSCMTGALHAKSQFLVYCWFLWLYLYIQAIRQDRRHYLLSHNFWYIVGFPGYTCTFRLSEALQEHYLLSHNFWYTVGFSGDTYTFRLSEAWQEHYRVSRNFWCIVGFSGYTYTLMMSGMTRALPAKSQLLVYCCGYTYTFRLSEAWQEHYLLGHNFWYTVVAIPRGPNC